MQSATIDLGFGALQRLGALFEVPTQAPCEPYRREHQHAVQLSDCTLQKSRETHPSVKSHTCADRHAKIAHLQSL